MLPVSRLKRLRRDKASGDPAPHKPLLLLVYIAVAEEGSLDREVLLSPELAFRFANLNSIVGWRRRQRLEDIIDCLVAISGGRHPYWL